MILGVLAALFGGVTLLAAPTITQQIAGLMMLGTGVMTIGLGAIERQASEAKRVLWRIEARLVKMQEGGDKSMAPLVQLAQRLNAVRKD